jgi:PAS domain S-box-containing protein
MAPTTHSPSDGTDIHRLLVESVHEYAIFALDPEGHVTSWNAGAQRLKGYTAAEIIGHHFSIFYPSDVAASGHPERELAIALDRGSYEEEGWRVRRDGTRFWANVVIATLRNEDGTLAGFAKVTRDLTERREAEQRRLDDARRVAEAEAANRAKSEFLASLSHELRTPLNAIGGYVELLALEIHGPVTDAQRESMERIRTSQRHLLALITDLLNYSRLEVGRIEYDIRPVGLDVLMGDVRAVVEPLAAARDIALEWPPPGPAVAVRVLADAPRADQVLLNLLTNAIKYTEPGGRVTVSCERGEDSIAIMVADTGIGIPDDQIEGIFEPFTQLGRSHTSAHEGIGLGLAISRELARAMGGDISVVSELGRGSAFTLSLPRADSQREAGGSPGARGVGAGSPSGDARRTG